MSGSGTQTAVDQAGRSTKIVPVRLGDVVLVNLGGGGYRPLLVAHHGQDPREDTPRVSGLISCMAEDHLLPAFRGGMEPPDDPYANIVGRPERNAPYAYGEHLRYGDGVGHWSFR